MRKQLQQRLILGLAGMMFAGLLTEAGLRVLIPHKLQFDLAWTRPDPDLGWRNRENWSGYFFIEGKYVPVRIGAEGFRSKTVTRAKPPGTVRVLLLGDSTTAGYEVPAAQTFGGLVERKLESALHRKAEVLNAGTRGWATDQSERLLRAEGLSFDPDVVVYTFCTNDLPGNVDPAKPHYVRRNDQLVWVQPPRPLSTRLDSWLRRHSYVYRLIVYMKIRRESRRPQGRAGAPAWMEEMAEFYRKSPERDEQWQLTFDLVRRMRDACRLRRVTFCLMPFVDRLECDAATQEQYRQAGVDLSNCNFTRVHETFESFCSQEGIQYVDAFARFRRTTSNRWGKSDAHWNARGHELAAEALTPVLLPAVAPEPSRRD